MAATRGGTRCRAPGLPWENCTPMNRLSLFGPQLEVRSLNVTWRRDLWCHRVIVFFFGNVSNCWLNSYGKFGGATVFSLSAESLRGVDIRPPPGRAREGNAALLMGSLLTGLSNCRTLVQLTALNRWLALPCPDLTVWRCLAAGASSWQASALL